MNCPRCKTAITTPVTPEGIISCPGCGARLMTRAAAKRSQGGPRSASEDSATAPVLRTGAPAHVDEHPPDVTAPSGLDFQIKVGAAAPVSAAPAPGQEHEGHEGHQGHQGHEGHQGHQGHQGQSITLATLRHEIQALQVLQQQTLDLLRQLSQGGAEPAADRAEGEPGPVLSPVRSQRRKSVLLVDDDAETREAAKAALEQADVPVRAITTGNAAVREIASEKPDVIVIELGITGDMAGKDVVNMIKATMEWVDIPIVLYTREAIDSQKEARQIHGADEIVRKASGAEALVACVITLFRRT